ncbi:MAG: hypothetical protein IPL79_18940 [Myxococcales bacterium]|nr:hypothetical protein [Myxococcales bacterium]
MNSPLANLLARDLSDIDREEVADVELTLEISDDGDDAEADDEPIAKSAVEQALYDAAQLASHTGVGLDVFMKAAWSAYLETHPEVHEKIERQALIKHLKMLRRTGKIGLA